MVRIKSSVALRKKRKRLLRKTKGQYAQKSRRFRQAKRSLMKGMVYAYRDRHVKKRNMRRLWITRINAACREGGITYSRFIRGLTKTQVKIDRKMLAELAVHSPEAFTKLIHMAKETANGAKAAA